MRGHVATLLFFVVILFVAIPTNALFTFLTEGTNYCFIEDLNEDTQVIVSYKCPTLDAKYRAEIANRAHVDQHEFSIKAEVRDPFGNVLLDRKITDPEGTVTFKSLREVSGIYEICFFPSSLAWFSSTQKIEFHVKVEIDYDAKESDKIESKERIDKLDEMIKRLKNQVEDVKHEQNYIQTRESRFKETTDSTHSRVFWMGFLQFSVLVGLGVWQILNLKSFFKAKKLV
ncbi:transmembrane emp24 domain-containing protein ECA [Acrasis kona]|uniref:Transmembrane emp24 domain-containing protein ECA n=1 Tax=Acrasis kona TaxID=1008807 RepID=A0AAW2YKY1_9EUKA